MSNRTVSRRDFTKIAGASALASVAIPAVHAAADETIEIALVGCGGRGSGATINALSTSGGPTKLVAMADVFERRLANTYNSLSKGEKAAQVDVPDDRKFIGLDSYKHAIDSLKPGSVAIFATPPAFRWVHFKYAIERGINVFMEKPLTIDGPTTKRMIALGEEAQKKNMKVGVGLMCRHCKARAELFDRIQNGEIGEIISMHAHRMHGPVVFAFSEPKPDPKMSDLMYQISRFHSFIWASGGLFSDFYIHNIDETCWMHNNKWPTTARGLGGRHFRKNFIDQNFDSYSVEYLFDDGVKFFYEGRTMDGCENRFASYVHGSKGSAVVSINGHTPARCKIYKGQKMSPDNVVWKFPDEEPNPYQLEWDDLMFAIRHDKPYNEIKRCAEASLVTSMGRFACHTGQPITFDKMLNDTPELAPNLETMTKDSEPPLKLLSDGKYPIPQPGIVKDREYASA